MQIKVRPKSKSPVVKVYSLSPKDRVVINHEFDKLHDQEKLK